MAARARRVGLDTSTADKTICIGFSLLIRIAIFIEIGFALSP